MKSGRPSNDMDELDRDIIACKLSFNQIKYLLYKFRYFQISSEEGKISEQLCKSLEKFLEKKMKQGKLPQSIEEQIAKQVDD